jgi:hypothetical protein
VSGVSSELETYEYFVILWREKDDWGWLRSLDGNEDCTTGDPSKRMRYGTVEAVMAAIWKFRRDNPKRPRERIRRVRVRGRMFGQPADGGGARAR